MKNFSKIIIWGWKLHSHTHSYIFDGFYKAFKYLGYETLWLDNDDNISDINFDNSLFITELQVEQKIPKLSSCKYVAHSIEEKNNFGYEPNLILHVFKHKHNINTKINDYTYEDSYKKELIQPWATNLLPKEFDFNHIFTEKKPEAYFLGSVHERPRDDMYGWNYNAKEIYEFENSCKEKNIIFDYRGLYTKGWISEEKTINLMKNAIAAPIIQGKEQIEAGYLPCRLWKNISYGHYGMTNSDTVNNFFNQFLPGLIYESPGNMLNKLFELKNKDSDKSMLIEQMKYIQNNHTYLNRIEEILKRI